MVYSPLWFAPRCPLMSANRHVGQLFLDHAEIGESLAESFPLLGIADGVVERVARPTHHAGAQLEAPNVENVEGDDVAFADLAQQIFFGNMAIVEHDARARIPANPHLLFFLAGLEASDLP